jgi:rubrerythrin
MFEKRVTKMSEREMREEITRLRKAAKCSHEQMSRVAHEEHDPSNVYHCKLCGHKWSD